MAKDKQTSTKPPGRIKQMVQVYNTTKQHDRSLTPLLLLVFVAPIVIAVLLAWLLDGGIIGWILWPVTGILVGLLLAMILLGRRAEAVAYQQIEGRPGAVGAVISGALRRSWRGSEVPVAITKQQDAVYRVVGRGGVVLIAEGSAQRTKPLLVKEATQLKRTLPGVKLTQLYVGPDEGGIPVARLSRTLLKLKPALTKAEVSAVHNRVSSLQSAPIGIPKGMDPTKVRPGKPR
jgi:F0F1-type ATP synthase assembly protein I